MWIKTQNKQRIINSDHVIDIFVAKTAPIIYANTTDDADYITLGEYKDKDTCLRVLDGLDTIIGTSFPAIYMPFGGDIDEWEKEVRECTRIYIASDLK